MTKKDREYLEKIKTLTFPGRRKNTLDPKKIAPTAGGVSVQRRERQIKNHMSNIRKNLRKGGFAPGGNMRLKAQVPVEVFEHVRRKDGQEASEDINYVIKESKNLGIDCEVKIK